VNHNNPIAEVPVARSNGLDICSLPCVSTTSPPLGRIDNFWRDPAFPAPETHESAILGAPPAGPATSVFRRSLPCFWQATFDDQCQPKAL
jgi:hypothetical protein